MPNSIKEKTKNLRRQHIREAAIKVFADRGFHRATIRDIANEAGVSDGTIYNIFENKMALLLGVLDPPDEDSVSDVPANLLGDSRSVIQELLQRRWKTFTPDTLNVLRIVFSEAMINEELCRLYIERVITPVLTLSEPQFQALANAGKISTDDVQMLLRTMTATVIGLVTLRLLGDAHTEAQWESFPEHLSGLLVEGLRPRLGGGR